MAVVDGPKFHWFPSNYIQMSSIIIYCNPFRKKDHRGQVGATDEKTPWVFQTPWPEKLKNSTSPSPVLMRIVSYHWIIDVNHVLYTTNLYIERLDGRNWIETWTNIETGAAIFPVLLSSGRSQWSVAPNLLVLHPTTTAYAEWCSDASASKPSMSYFIQRYIWELRSYVIQI